MNQVLWCTPVAPATEAAQAGGTLNARSLSSAWATWEDPVSKQNSNKKG